jgi:hypothetical protein
MSEVPLMEVRSGEGGWLLEGPWPEPLGPWPTKQEAEGHRVALVKTYRHWREPGFVTSERVSNER